MAWELGKVKTLPLTKTLAKRFVEMEATPGERPFRPRRVDAYKWALEHGEWRPMQWAEATCLQTDTVYRVNGQHTSRMFAEMDPIPEGLFVTVESYACETLQDVAKLYNTFDSAMQSRSTTDINRAFAGTRPELRELPSQLIDRAAAGLAIYACGGNADKARHLPAQDKGEALLDNVPFILWVHEIIGNHYKFAHLLRSGVLAAMLATWKKSKSDATEFWVAVRDETGARPQCPDRVLARWLREIRIRAKAERRGGLLDQREFMVRALYAWNAWRRKEDLRLLKYQPAAKLPAIA